MPKEDIKDQVNDEEVKAESAEKEAEPTEEASAEASADIEDTSNDHQEELTNDPVHKLEAELAEQKDKYIRMYSDFENFRRRTAKEKLDLIKTASESLMTNLLPVMDDFERAFKAFEEGKEKDADKFKEGIELIKNKFQKALKDKGLKEMEVGQGSDFDAELHEAITQIPAPSEELKGKVVDVVEKGYLLDDKVIRYAKVVTGA